MKAILKDGTELQAFHAPMPHHLRGLLYTRTGYGKKIPTEYTVKYNRRYYRVYCCIFSNVGTCYITSKGTDLIVDLERV